jgi:hypothetical protein
MGSSKRSLVTAASAASAGLGLATLALAATAPALAATTTVKVGAFDTGYYCTPTGIDPVGRCPNPHTPSNTSYQTGYIDITSGSVDVDLIFRGFFVFNLNNSQINQALSAGDQLLSATVTARNGVIACGAVVDEGDPCSPPQAVDLYGVQGSIDDLINGTSSFNDLGQGAAFAGASFPTITTQNSISTYNLNSNGLVAVNSALMGRLALSARNRDEVGEANESPLYVYGNTSTTPSTPSVFLTLEFGPSSGAAVPSPLPLFGAGAAWSWSRRLRRRCQGEIRGSEADAGIEQRHQ